MEFVRYAAPLLALLAAVPPARAQGADTSAISTAVWTACPGARLQVAAGGERVHGRCGELANGSLLVRTDSLDRRIQLVDVDSLWVRRGRTADATLLLGSLGAVVGVIIGEELGPDECFGAFGCSGEARVVTLRTAAAGALTGAALGLVLGSRLTYWRLRFP